MKEIIFATNNKHKLQEIRGILQGKFKVLSLAELGFDEDIPETAETLAENASLKSSVILDRFKQDCFADDTGLEIEALDGRPGVYSARYAGEACNAENNMQKVLTELHGKENRSARFRTVISLWFNGQEYLFEGEVNGSICHRKHGGDGFGYDPIFKPDGYDETFAEMSIEMKNEISHRARAVKKLANFLALQE